MNMSDEMMEKITIALSGKLINDSMIFEPVMDFIKKFNKWIKCF